MSGHIVRHEGTVGPADRARLLDQRGAVLWLTGLSGAGKSTVARAVEAALLARGHLGYVLDGDNLRFGLNGDLGFSASDRTENVRRLGEVAALFADAGLLTLVAAVAPYAADRARARAAVGPERFIEIHVDPGLEECERRDPKGFYARARAGVLRDSTGVDAPYEAPLAPEIHLDTAALPLTACVERLLAHLETHGFLGNSPREV